MNGLFGSSSWLYILLVGFFVGLLGRFFMPGNNRMGCLLTIVLGILGALLAGWFGQYMGWYAPGEPVVSSVRWSARWPCWPSCACSATAADPVPASLPVPDVGAPSAPDMPA